MKTKILSILASGLIVLTGLLTTASTFPGHKVPDPAPPVIEQGAITIRITIPRCAVGVVPANPFQAMILWLETWGPVSFSIAGKGESALLHRTIAIGPIDLPTGK